jgi:hypothetical protein
VPLAIPISSSNANKAFVNALKFAQEIGSWDVSNVTDMSSMFSHFANIPTANILVKVNSVPKHSVHISHLTIQSNVNWGIVDYTDATARQYLIDTYHWSDQ